jgi:hypothetical protein
MRLLTTPGELQRAEAAGREVFRSFDVRSSQPFRESVEARLLVYPIGYTMLEPEQFGALAAAAATVGDGTAFLVGHGDPEAGWVYKHRLVDLADFLEDEAVKALVRDWREIDRSDGPGWLRQLIEHVYGEDRRCGPCPRIYGPCVLRRGALRRAPAP